MTETIELKPFIPPPNQLVSLLPDWAKALSNLQTDIPELAKNPARLAELESLLSDINTLHRSIRGDARELLGIEPETVHLVLTSPPYWTLKQYRDRDGQMGHIEELAFEPFLISLIGRIETHKSATRVMRKRTKK